VAFESITSKRLLLEFTAPGMTTVQIAHHAGSARNPNWRTIKTILVKVNEAGEVEIKLPRLSPGRYRVSVSLAGAKTVVKTLTVPSRRR
jgi:hypothetical protein